MNDQQAIDQWNERLREQMNRGKTKLEAIRIIVRKNPELHRAYLLACNRGRPAAVRELLDMGDNVGVSQRGQPGRTKPTGATQEAVKRLDAGTIDEWNTAIREQTERGKSKLQAVRIVARKNPDLHRRYLIACNRHRPSAVRQLLET